MGSAEDGQVGALPPTLMLLIGLVLLFGFVVIARAGMMERWSFDRVALAIGGFTIIVAGRAAAAVMARKKRELRRETDGRDAAVRPNGPRRSGPPAVDLPTRSRLPAFSPVHWS